MKSESDSQLHEENYVFNVRQMVSNLRHVNSVHIPSYPSLTINFNIIFHLQLGFPFLLFYSGFPTKILQEFVFFFMHLNWLIYFIISDLLMEKTFSSV